MHERECGNLKVCIKIERSYERTLYFLYYLRSDNSQNESIHRIEIKDHPRSRYL